MLHGIDHNSPFMFDFTVVQVFSMRFDVVTWQGVIYDSQEGPYYKVDVAFLVTNGIITDLVSNYRNTVAYNCDQNFQNCQDHNITNTAMRE